MSTLYPSKHNSFHTSSLSIRRIKKSSLSHHHRKRQIIPKNIPIKVKSTDIIHVTPGSSSINTYPKDERFGDYNTHSQNSTINPFKSINREINSINIDKIDHYRKFSFKSNNYDQYSFDRKQFNNQNKQNPNRKRKRIRKCCCPYSYLCIFCCLLAGLLLAVGLAALIIALVKPQTVTTLLTTSATITTITETTTTTITETTTTSTTSTVSTVTTTTTTTTTVSTATTTTSTTTTQTSSTTVSSTSTSATTTTTTTSRPMCPITRAGDPIRGLYNTKAGGSTGGFEGRYSPYTEKPPQAIDNDVTTKYLNYGTTSVMNANQSQPGQDSGFYVTPTMSNISLANGLIFATAGDYPARDPLTVTLEGTNATALNSSSIWTLIYNGSTGLDSITARQTYGTLQVFSNSFVYRSYRLLITSQRFYQDSVQYAEAHIMTYC